MDAHAVSNESDSWSVPRRVAFRLVAVYLVVYAVFNGNSAGLPLSPFAFDGDVPAWFTKPVDWVTAGFGHLLGVHGDISAADNGSGDRVGNYVQLVLFVSIAAIGAAVWSFLARRRTDERRALALSLVFARYVVASTMLVYGFAKVFPSQFPLPHPLRLVEPYGDASPMGLLWTFMGASPAYTIFGGLAEVTGAVLLFFRRTATLGALVSAGVLANVVLLNFCYDVCVKLASSHLFLMCLFVAAPSVPRLLDVFVRHRGTTPDPIAKVSGPRWWRRAYPFVKLAIVAFCFYVAVVPVARQYYTEGDGAPRPALLAAYEVQELVRDGNVVPPLLTDPTYWRYVSIGRRFAAVTMVDGTNGYFGVKLDDPAAHAALTRRKDGATFDVTRAADGTLEMRGSWDGHDVVARARPLDPKHELLVRRGFHWVNEYPFNR